MHIFSLINKAYAIIKRDMGGASTKKAAIFIDKRDTGTYVTAAQSRHVYATVQWRSVDPLHEQDDPVHEFLNLDFVRDAAKAAYKEVDFDGLWYADVTNDLREISNAVEGIDYEPLSEIETLSGIEIFAPLTKSKGVKKMIKSRENLQQAYVSGGLRCFTTGHFLVQKEVPLEETQAIPFTILEIMNTWKNVEWLYASSDEANVRFHGITEGRSVTLSYRNIRVKGPDVSVIQEEFRPPSFFIMESDALFTFVKKIGKSFGQDDTIYFTYNEGEGVELSLSKTEITPDNEEVYTLGCTKYTDGEYCLTAPVDRIKNGKFRSAWKASYFVSCLGAVGELVEFIVPIEESGEGNKPCSFIGVSADALVMPKRL